MAHSGHKSINSKMVGKNADHLAVIYPRPEPAIIERNVSLKPRSLSSCSIDMCIR